MLEPDPRRRSIAAVLLLLLALLPFAAEALDRPFLTVMASRVLIFGMAAVALDLVLGVAGLVSFGHAAFIGIGAYTVAILGIHAADGWGTWSAWISWPAAVLVSAAVALPMGAIALRTGGVHFIMITLALAQMLYYAATGLSRYGGDDGTSLMQRSTVAKGIDMYDPAIFYWIVLGLLAAVLFLLGRLSRARFGFVLRGVKANERRLQALGLPTFRYKLAAFVLSGAICGLAGALLANHAEFVSPAYMQWSRSGELIVMVILGGMGTLVGPVVGAAALLLLEELLAEVTQHWMLVLGPLLVLAVLFARRGLWGLVERLLERRQP